MNVKVKKLVENALIPKYSSEGDAGLDFYTVDSGKIEITSRGTILTYKTGIALEIPEGHVGLIFPRSSISDKTSFMLSNSVGVIDSNFRGEVTFKFRDMSNGYGKRYKEGDRIGQLVIIPIPNINLIEVTELTETNRGEGSYGSSGD